ncbi:hypothetical protein BOVATA_049990 [Babesia ovata]|uniref:Uncharacterized protein n=1 Tax=Babesia ovata TaxID=189622 RepID=A0A2H6KKI7_9APIC|nr:uncharacterized protein BOVATA_049990 [Babesia ovata]GBE63506.1 hypothetical protein BOVATA_049990 [Babesia ovata]
MYCGPSKFAEGIDIVKRILRDYDTTLTERTKNVNDSLSELSINLNDKYVTEVNSKISEPLEKQLTAWRDTVHNLEAEVNKIQTDNINVLDKSLRDRIMHEFMPVKSVVEHMRKSSTVHDFESKVRDVDVTLDRQRSYVRNVINDESRTVKDAVARHIYIMVEQTRRMKQNIEEHFKTINDRLDDAHDMITNFDSDYKAAITGKFHDIKTAVNNIYSQLDASKEGVGKLAGYVHREFEAIKNGVEKDNGSGGENGESIEKKWEDLQGHIRG